MNEVSTLSRALVYDKQVSLAVLDTTALVREGGRRHLMKGDALVLFGKVLTAVAYQCGWLKEENSSLSVTLDADGDFGKISVSGDGNLNLRGYLENAGRERGRLGGGTLSVVLDRGAGLPFSGTVPLVSEEIGKNFAYYFRESEQRPTLIVLSVLLNGDGSLLRAGGAFLQALPSADEEVKEKIFSEQRFLEEYLGAGKCDEIFSRFGAECAERRTVRFACRCSREKAESLVLSLGREEAERLCEEEGQVAVHCGDCNTDYLFSREHIRRLFEKHE